MSLLSDALNTKLIPWSQYNISDRFIIARPKMNARQVPKGVRLSICTNMGPRVVVRKNRYYRNTRGTTALWPEAQLNETFPFKLVCILDGDINYQLDNTLLQCGPGYFIFIPPGIPHPTSSFSFIDAAKGNSCEILYFHLYDDAVQWWITHSQTGQKILTKSNSLFSGERIVALLRILMKEVLDDQSDSLDIGAQLLPIFLQVLKREIGTGHFQTIRSENPDDFYSPLPAGTQDFDFTTRLERFIQANLHKPLTLESTAHEMYVSRSQFAILVRRETGKTFNELLNAHRIEAAKNLLQDSPWSITAIAGFVGFKSSSYFRTLFHKHTNQTPMQFRKRMQKNPHP